MVLVLMETGQGLTWRVRSSEMREMLILWRPMAGVCVWRGAGELAVQSSHSVQEGKRNSESFRCKWK